MHRSTKLSRLLHVSLVAGLLVVVVVRVYGYFVASRSSDDAVSSESMADVRVEWAKQGDEAFDEERWEAAVAAYRKVVELYPNDIVGWYRLAMSLHQNGDLDDALNAWIRLCDYRQARRIALFNIACIYALQDEKQLALDYLQEAIDAGFERKQSISEDPDLASLVDDPEFKRLEELAKPIGLRNTYRRFDFILGKWHLVAASGRRVGTFDVASDNNGYTLLGRLVNNANSTNITIISYFEPGLGSWKQVWVDDSGTVTQLQQVEGEEDTLVLEGGSVTSEGKHRRTRVVYTEDDEGAVSQQMFTSPDGHAWDLLLEFKLEPREPRKKSFLEMPLQG